MLHHSLIAILPWSGNSLGTFRSSSQAATCLPFAAEASRCPFLMLRVIQGSCEYQSLQCLV